MSRCKLKDHIRIKHGYAFDGEFFSEEDNGVVLVTPGNFAIGGGFQEGKGKYYKGEYPQDYVLEPGDLIVTMTDLSKAIDTLGYAALVPDDGRVYLHNQRVGLVEFMDAEIDKGYLHYLLRSHNYQRTIAGSSSGSTVHHTSPDKICSYEFELPSKDEQIRIAQILSTYETLIKNNRKQIKLLEEAAQRLYKEWFIDLRFPGHEDATIDPETGLPEGWKPGSPLGELIEKLESGKRPKGGIDKSLTSGVPSIGAENVLGVGRYNYASEKIIPVEYFEGMRKGVVRDRDILVYKDGAYTGRVSLVQDGFPYEKCAVNEHVFLVTAKKESDQYWLYFTLEREDIFNAVQKVAISSAQPGINQDDFKSIKILIPTEDLRRQYGQTVVKLVSQIILLAKQNRAAELARDRLLPKLMEGEVGL